MLSVHIESVLSILYAQEKEMPAKIKARPEDELEIREQVYALARAVLSQMDTEIDSLRGKAKIVGRKAITKEETELNTYHKTFKALQNNSEGRLAIHKLAHSVFMTVIDQKKNEIDQLEGQVRDNPVRIEEAMERKNDGDEVDCVGHLPLVNQDQEVQRLLAESRDNLNHVLQNYPISPTTMDIVLEHVGKVLIKFEDAVPDLFYVNGGGKIKGQQLKLEDCEEMAKSTGNTVRFIKSIKFIDDPKKPVKEALDKKISDLLENFDRTVSLDGLIKQSDYSPVYRCAGPGEELSIDHALEAVRRMYKAAAGM